MSARFKINKKTIPYTGGVCFNKKIDSSSGKILIKINRVLFGVVLAVRFRLWGKGFFMGQIKKIKKEPFI